MTNPFLRIVAQPQAGWDAVAAANPRWHASLLRHALPLALLPALAWPIGHALDPIAPRAISFQSLVASFATTLALFLGTILLCAAAIYALAPFFEAERNWDRCFAVAAYASTPALLGAPLVVSATLTIVALVMLFHSCFLCSVGVQRVLGCRPNDAALFVAAIAISGGLGGALLGALCAAIIAM